MYSINILLCSKWACIGWLVQCQIPCLVMGLVIVDHFILFPNRLASLYAAKSRFPFIGTKEPQTRSIQAEMSTHFWPYIVFTHLILCGNTRPITARRSQVTSLDMTHHEALKSEVTARLTGRFSAASHQLIQLSNAVYLIQHMQLLAPNVSKSSPNPQLWVLIKI